MYDKRRNQKRMQEGYEPMKRKKPVREVIGVITQLDLIQKGANKLNKGSDAIVRQGTGVQESKKHQKELKKKTTRQYLTDYDRGIEPVIRSL